jgi:hypothetical protein
MHATPREPAALPLALPEVYCADVQIAGKKAIKNVSEGGGPCDFCDAETPGRAQEGKSEKPLLYR